MLKPAPKIALPAAVLIVLAITGCGALPPQAPLQYAKKLDSATSGISTACGETSRLTAFPGNHRRDLNGLESTAVSDVRKLVKVFKRDRNWIYQGFTVAEIASDGVAMLSSCGLKRAAQQLKQATTSS